ncbi:unnamed protein product [Rotaria sp. Silwood1]|nr:unnamed protein product [Rotaria sp. Silwood1]
MFSTQVHDNFNEEQCPMLIGIMRLFEEKKNDSVKVEYQVKSLLVGDTLTRTQVKSNRETVLNELAIFKEECDENEQALSFNFITKTHLCYDFMCEIVKYLTLNDAINVFSANILPSLRQYETKVEICQPSNVFINTIARKLKPEQIVSLRLDTTWYSTQSELDSLIMFTNVISLTLLNFQEIKSIKQYEKYLPKLIRLSLWYDHEVSLGFFSRITEYMPSSIKRFEIHCSALACSHFYTDQYSMISLNKPAIEYFLLDMGEFSLPSISNCLQQHQSCILMTTIDLITTMTHIRHVRLITNTYNVMSTVDLNQWSRLAKGFHQLKKITLKIMGNMLYDDELMDQIETIQKRWWQAIEFEVIFV